MNRAVGLIDILLFAGLALMWGSAFLMIKVALSDFLPVDIVFWRLATASLVLAVYAFWTRTVLPRSPRFWLLSTALGLASNALPFLLVSWSETEVDSGFAAILIASTPLWIAGLIPIFVREESLSGGGLFGLIIGFVGVVVLMGGLDFTSLGGNLLAKLGLLGAALSYAVGVILIRRLHNYPAPATALAMNATGFAGIAVAALAFGSPFAHMPSLPSLLSVASLGIFSSATASMVLVILIQRVGAARAGVTNYLVPVVAAVLGVLVLDEPLRTGTVAGLALILAGVWISSRAKAR